MKLLASGHALVLLLLLLSPGSLDAQDTPERAWRTQIELGLNGARGNSSFTVFRTGFTVTHLRTEAAEVELTGVFNYGKSNDELISRNWRTSLKVDLVPESAVSPFVFATTSGDELRRQDLRSEGGAGAKYTFWRGEAGSASISMASLYSYEDFEQDPAMPELPAERSARWSFRAKAQRRLGGSEIAHTTFYQPVWNRGDDYLVDALTTLSTTIVGAVTLSIEHEYMHDATPPPEVRRDDQRLSVVFKYAF
jgi:hypothetical protein